MNWMRPFWLASVLLFLFAVGCAETQSDRTPGGGPRYADLDDDTAPPPDLVIRTLDDLGAGTGKVFTAIAEVPIGIWGMFHRKLPSDAAREMENPYSPDDRRNGINELVNYPFAQHPPYTNRYRQIALFDTDPLVRAVAIRALNRCRDQNSVGVWEQALGDPSPLVRLEAAKALVHIPDSDAAPALLAMLRNPDENRDVRIACADALQHYPTLSVARELSTELAEREFGVAWQSRRSLRILTGRDYGYDQAAWLDYFSGPDRPF
jgi:hypothetical protein